MKRFTLLSILIIIFTGCSQSPEQLVKNGDAFIDTKKYDEAIKVYEQVLKKYPGNIEAHRGIINAYTGKSMLEVILGDYKAKYDKNPNDPLLAYLVGNCYARKDNFIKAFEYYNKAESLGFKSKWLYYSRGSCYVSIGIILTKKEKAITEFRQLSLSNTLDAFNKAVESYNKVLQLDKEMLAVYEDLCTAYSFLDKDKDALNMAIEAEKRGSKESVIYTLLAKDASSSGKYDNVIKYTSKLVECNSDENTYLIYAAVVAPRSDAGGVKGELRKKALADLAEGINKYPALKKDPTFVACYVALLFPDKKAFVFLDECLKATPNLADGSPLLGKLIIDMSNALVPAVKNLATGAAPFKNNGEEKKLDKDVYFPVKLGNLWEYYSISETSKARRIVFVSNVKEVKGAIECEFTCQGYIIDSMNFPVGYEYYRISKDKVENLIKESDAIIKLPNYTYFDWDDPVLQNPIIEDAKWVKLDPNIVGGKPMGEYKYEVKSISETVKMPAGEFKNCLKIKQVVLGDVSYYYYAPNIGFLGYSSVDKDNKETFLRGLVRYEIK